MFKISEATEADFPSIIQIAEATWWPTYRDILTHEQIRYMLDAIYTPESLAKQKTDQAQVFLIGKDDGGPQGFTSYAPRSENSDVYKLHKLYVLPHNHKRGYGRMLIDAVRSRMLQANKYLLDVNVNRYNPALRFYENYGFKIIGEEDVPIGPYWMNDYVLRIDFSNRS
ncbi:MAG TPA: GNAT family N-acetyltransferase [Chryseosolibacter sp.]|nr:GNAT family N-acetyltransferase [Chryseosolibacter sp.]